MKRGTARAEHRATRVRRAKMLGMHYRWTSQAKFGWRGDTLGGGRRGGPPPFGRDDRQNRIEKWLGAMQPALETFVRGWELMAEAEDEAEDEGAAGRSER